VKNVSKASKGIGQCVRKQPIEPIYADAMVKVIAESIATSPVVIFIEHQFENWGKTPATATEQPAAPKS